jgi:hypothetical protein
MEFLKTLNFEEVIADPLLMMGIFLVIVGPLFFIVALWKVIFFKKPLEPGFIVPDQDSHELETINPSEHSVGPVSEIAAEPVPEHEPQPMPIPTAAASPIQTFESVHASQQTEPASDRTIVMPSGMADLHAQMELIFTQVKQLNKRSAEFETSLEDLTRKLLEKYEPNTLKEPVADQKDLMQKLLKIAEHVIALEKDVAKLKAATPTSASSKAQIMPL